MSAVIGVLNESLTESIKGFYKLRKAYVTLDGILAAEASYMKKREGLGMSSPAQRSAASLRSNRSARSMKGGAINGAGLASSIRPSPLHAEDKAADDATAPEMNEVKGGTQGRNLDEEESDEEFFDAEDDHKHDKLPEYMGNLKIDGQSKKTKNGFTENEAKAQAPDLPPPKQLSERLDLLNHDPDSDIFSNPIDVFIHSGANLCFGLLLVMISMIPPAFSKLLFIIGFHGDKERGVRMLWQASKFHNINGAFAGLIVLGYYNTLIGFADIVPDNDPAILKDNPTEGYPRQRCEALLQDMRARHPKSHLWLLEEARMNAFNKHLTRAVQMLDTSTKSPLKQVEALKMFEKSLDAMYSHDFALCSTSFIACVSLNNWSHALYYYIAGAAQIELYRAHKLIDPATAKKHAAKADELLHLAPQHAGKKKFMARQLPFDVFVTRKLKKWEHRASEWSCPFVDAVGISPLEEMIFFWNGYKRMDDAQLTASLTHLSWSSDAQQNPLWQSHESGADERAVLAVLTAATLRNLRRYDEARAILQRDVLSVDRNELKGGLRDDWTAPAAHYEMGVVCWMEKDRVVGGGDGNGNGGVLRDPASLTVEKKVRECETWIEKAAKWEGYELDARIGLKIATAQDTLKRWFERWKGGSGRG